LASGPAADGAPDIFTTICPVNRRNRSSQLFVEPGRNATGDRKNGVHHSVFRNRRISFSRGSGR
jgi:hypothetical protein